MSPLQQPLRATLCVTSGFFAFQLIHSAFIAFGALSWHRLETRQALQEPISPNNRPTPGRYNQKSTFRNIGSRPSSSDAGS